METISDPTDATSASTGAIALPNIPPPANETISDNKKLAAQKAHLLNP
jgi:hypothetical protein